MSEWINFWFEGNIAWGVMDSPEKWEHVKQEYKTVEPDMDLSKARQHRKGGNSYGFYSEYDSEDTLGDFFKRNNMEI